MNEMLLPNIRLYAERHQLELTDALGSGKDGIVLVAKRKKLPSKLAIKALRWQEPYDREKKVYERLAASAAAMIAGFNVPQYIGLDDELQILEMTIVERPFVLDFAGAHLDRRPDFPPEVWAEWESEKREQFEGRWPEVQKILDAFEEFGIYLLDPSPGNIGFA
jgi:hypothetical protein